MSEQQKRSYTVPILLVLVTVLTTFVIILYSRQLIDRQTASAGEGRRLSERYAYAQVFADRLGQGADLLLRGDETAARMQAKARFGEAIMAGGETLGLLTEARHRSTGQPYEEAFKPLSVAMTAILSEQSGRIYTVAEHDGSLTAEEREMLQTVRDGAARMEEALLAYQTPTTDSGYRGMNAGEGWVQPALAAAQALEDMASQMK